MRCLTVLALVTLVLACGDSGVLQPDYHADLQLGVASKGNPHNPFVGVWWGIDPDDNSLQRVNISHQNSRGDMQVNFRDDAASLCNGFPLRFHTVGRVLAENENVLKLPEYENVCQNPAKDVIVTPPIVGFEYVPASDGLRLCLVPESEVVACFVDYTRKKP